ncbi:DNA primase [Periweissella fabalis]|uniref:DNA primase n=1 Tax=Periweissella fabalis TaxID=1070421 RepID=A0A7X6N1N8_9LACO|nr:DNA primase [Periweissella fabalis]MCM0599368.1 DNA primase [Periweissella fabalis]NKZ23647.1 DNA primase [Periweissella fabalis]
MATRIPEDVINQVRTAVNITDVVSEYVQLHKQGRNLFGKCPWHDERTPSFSVNEQKQIFHCFSCGRGGNVFQFLTEMKNLSFPEAVLEVAKIAHIEIDQQYVESTNSNKPANEHAALYDLYAEAAKLYHHMLMNTSAGQDALDYLHQRGLDDDTLDLFHLGYAPKEPLLLPFFQERGVDYQLLRQSELFIENEDGSLRDRFVNRVLFTIRNSNGQVIAFSGRSLTHDEQAKYINSPESVLFNKSQELFNFDLAKNPIKRSKDIILFEGFMDVIAAFSAGVQNGVASMGTSLTVEQVKKISRIANRILIAYDGDAAGQAATKRAIDLINQVAPALSIQIINLPDGLDPDEYLRKYGKQEFTNAVTHGLETPVTFAMRYLKQGRNLANEAEKLGYLDEVLKMLATVDNPLERDLQVNQLAQEFNVGATSLHEQLKHLIQQMPMANSSAATGYKNTRNSNLYGQKAATSLPEPQLKVRSRTERAERTLLVWMLHDWHVWQEVTAISDFHFTKLEYETLFLLAQGYWSTHHQYDLGLFLDYLNDTNLARVLTDLENDVMISQPSLPAVKQLIDQIMHVTPLVDQIKQKLQQISEAQQLGNNELLVTLTNEYIILLRQQHAQQ